VQVAADQSLDKFKATLARLSVEHPAGLDVPTIGLAVSGGPDSLALLLLAHDTFPRGIRVATVDHRLRVEAAEEASYVARICRDRGIAHDILVPDVPISGNIQSAAREARYGLLHRWANVHSLKWIATAHHADDQLETILMRIARGSGLPGLAAIREVNGRVIRPLLGFAKVELVAICQAHNVAPCEDPSNADLDFDRVQIRNWLKSAPDLLDARRASRTSAALREAHDALEWVAEWLEQERLEALNNNALSLDASGLPRELQRRLLLRSLQKIDSAVSPRGDTIDRALATLRRGQKLTVGDISCMGGSLWRFEPAPPRGTNHQTNRKNR
jgi:tRNA(Ile)-lysidine synthase